MVRWEKALTVWRSFHCDLKDLTSWLNRVERILADTKMPNGDLNVDAAMSEQRVRWQLTSSPWKPIDLAIVGAFLQA